MSQFVYIWKVQHNLIFHDWNEQKKWKSNWVIELSSIELLVLIFTSSYKQVKSQ